MLDTLSKGFQGLLSKFAGKSRITEDNVKDALREVRLALLEADVNLTVARAFIDRVKEKALGVEVISGVNAGQMIVKIIRDELVTLMGSSATPIAYAPAPPTVILMAGLQGSGKTTTCGKLALHLKKQGKSVLLAAADLQRPAAVEQLSVLGRDLDVPVFTEAKATPPEVCEHAVAKARADGVDVVILDTAGRLHVDDALMNEVAEVAARTSPHEVFLVCDAMTGQDAVNSAKAFNDRLPLTGVILTKLDGDARGGAALSVREVTGRPIRFVGIGEKLDKLDVFHPDRMADRILGMGDVVSLVEKAQQVIDQDEAREQAEKMFVGSFNLDDFLRLIGKIRGMGTLKDLLGMIPGLGQQMGNMPIDEEELPRSEAIILSMTPVERYHPEVLNTSRRERIAAGAGVTLEDVNELMRGFKEMKRQFSEFRKMGILGNILDPTRKMKKEKERELERMKKMGVNLFDPAQVKAFKQFSERKARQEARREKRRKRG
jgi:signal recognition particle subunit SRP54